VDYHQIGAAAKLQALIDSILVIEGDDDLTYLLSTVVEQAAALVGARYGALGILSDDGERLAQFITVGLSDAERAAIGPFPVGKGLLGRVITDAAPLRVEHLSERPDRSGFPPSHPEMESFLGVPVRLGAGTVFGNLYLCEKLDGTPFNEEDEVLTDTLGRVAGLLIDKAQLRAKLTELTLATERERMARDLHDTVIQRLFAVGLMLQGAASAELPDKVRRTLDQAVDDLDETIREIRTTIFAITSGPRSDATTLRRRLLGLTDEVSGRLGLEISLSINGPVDAVEGPAIEQVIVAAREALANVIRHAEASRADVDLTASAAGLTLRITDDGRGIDPDAPRVGRGLDNLTARALELGGWCTVGAVEPQGTVVEWHVAKVRGDRP
jgi:signal transduction histidine kinase